MHTLSSAKRTCMASASAVEWTATVRMPSSLAARSTRRAISPRLAIRIFWNMPFSRSLLDDDQRLALFDRPAVFEQDRGYRARPRRRDLIHRLHGFDDQQRLALAHLLADRDERLGFRR